MCYICAKTAQWRALAGFDICDSCHKRWHVALQYITPAEVEPHPLEQEDEEIITQEFEMPKDFEMESPF